MNICLCALNGCVLIAILILLYELFLTPICFYLLLYIFKKDKLFNKQFKMIDLADKLHVQTLRFFLYCLMSFTV